MGRFLNPGNEAFSEVIHSEIYVDKTPLLEYTNRVISTTSKFICSSRPRRFGKSITAEMLSAYYSKGSDSRELFADYAIHKAESFEKHLNQYDVIHFDVQWCMMDAGRMAPYVGFTEAEVHDLCDRYGQNYEQVKSWYDGYSLEGYQVYNPKAVVSLMLNGKYKSYWSNTGSYEAIVPLINMNFDGLRAAIIEMMSGAAVDVDVTSFQNDTVSFANRDDILTYLIHLGYLAYDQDRQQGFIPNEEIRHELNNAVKRNKWNEMITFQKESTDLLDATLDMDEKAVADGVERIHQEYSSVIQYNDENSLSSVLTIAYLSSMQYYFKPIRELPAGRGFADFVYLPKPEYKTSYPALLVELKWNKSTDTAMEQIRDKKYPDSILEYTGDLLLVGINYNKRTKEHECRIEKIKK